MAGLPAQPLAVGVATTPAAPRVCRGSGRQRFHDAERPTPSRSEGLPDWYSTDANSRERAAGALRTPGDRSTVLVNRHGRPYAHPSSVRGVDARSSGPLGDFDLGEGSAPQERRRRPCVGSPGRRRPVCSERRPSAAPAIPIHVAHTRPHGAQRNGGRRHAWHHGAPLSPSLWGGGEPFTGRPFFLRGSRHRRGVGRACAPCWAFVWRRCRARWSTPPSGAPPGGPPRREGGGLTTPLYLRRVGESSSWPPSSQRVRGGSERWWCLSSASSPRCWGAFTGAPISWPGLWARHPS